MDKAAWREELLSRRRMLTPAARRCAALAIARSALSLPEMGEAETVGLYADFRGEVPTARLGLLLHLCGKSVAIPAVVPRSETMVFRRVSHWRQLAPGAYGIREPGPGCPLVAPARLDLLVVPGVGFDRRGFRLGYGAGYYDRYLPALRRGCLRVGLAYACQVVPFLPHVPQDQAVDVIVTEREAIRTSWARI